jgi:hypothetical protein
MSPEFSARQPNNRYTNNKGGCRMFTILRRPKSSDILLALIPA